MTAVIAITSSCKGINTKLLHDVIETIQNNPARYGIKYTDVMVAGLQLAINKN